MTRLTSIVLFVTACANASSDGPDPNGVNPDASSADSGDAPPATVKTCTFKPNTLPTLPTGVRPLAVHTGDFNSDGLQDLANLSSTDATIDVHLGTGAGKFLAPAKYATPANPWQFAIADFDGGGPDFAVVGESATSQLWIIRGNADGTFATHAAFVMSPTTANKAIEMADVDKDGKTDIVTSNFDANSVRVSLGNGGNGFLTNVTRSVPLQPMQIEVADVDKNGWPDLVVKSRDAVTTYPNTSGQFGTGATLAVNTSAIAVDDFDNDGKPDLVGAEDAALRLFRGAGNGTFQAQSQIAGTPRAVDVATKDLDLDGNVDVVAVSWLQNSVYVAFGNGDGTFDATQTYAMPDAPSSVAIADFTQDGRLDLAVAVVSTNTIHLLAGSCD